MKTNSFWTNGWNVLLAGNPNIPSYPKHKGVKRARPVNHLAKEGNIHKHTPQQGRQAHFMLYLRNKWKDYPLMIDYILLLRITTT